MAVNNGKQSREAEQIPKSGLSSDCRLKLACMKLELLVIADQHAAVNTFPGLVHTARHTLKVDCTRSYWTNLYTRIEEVGTYGVVGNWGEVVTR